MTIEGISSSQNFQAASAQKRGGQFRQDLEALSQALGTGDLSAAQSAFATIEQLQQGDPGKQSTSADPTAKHGNGTLRSDMDAIGKALKGGDLKGAQDAFKKLQQDAQAMKRSHHSHSHMMIPQDPADSTTDPTTGIVPVDNDASSGEPSTGIINLSA